MKYLIPPSEGKSVENSGNIKFKDTKYPFKNNVESILTNLKFLNEKEILKLYNFKIEKSILIHNNNLNILNGYCTPAIKRYTGTVFKHIDWDTLDSDEKQFFNNNFYIFSGLFGILKPSTMIPNYKLKMNGLLLYNFWKPTITKYLSKEDCIIDLLPQIHKKAYKKSNNSIDIEFKVKKNGNILHSGHQGKVVKGKFIRFLCKNQINDYDNLKAFKYDGYKWNGKYFLKTL